MSENNQRFPSPPEGQGSYSPNYDLDRRDVNYDRAINQRSPSPPQGRGNYPQNYDLDARDVRYGPAIDHRIPSPPQGRGNYPPDHNDLPDFMQDGLREEFSRDAGPVPFYNRARVPSSPVGRGEQGHRRSPEYAFPNPREDFYDSPSRESPGDWRGEYGSNYGLIGREDSPAGDHNILHDNFRPPSPFIDLPPNSPPGIPVSPSANRIGGSPIHRHSPRGVVGNQPNEIAPITHSGDMSWMPPDLDIERQDSLSPGDLFNAAAMFNSPDINPYGLNFDPDLRNVLPSPNHEIQDDVEEDIHHNNPGVQHNDFRRFSDDSSPDSRSSDDYREIDGFLNLGQNSPVRRERSASPENPPPNFVNYINEYLNQNIPNASPIPPNFNFNPIEEPPDDPLDVDYGRPVDDYRFAAQDPLRERSRSRSRSRSPRNRY